MLKYMFHCVNYRYPTEQQNTRTYSSHPALTLYPNILSSPFVVRYIYILRLLGDIKDADAFLEILFLYNHFLQMNLPFFFSVVCQIFSISISFIF